MKGMATHSSIFAWKILWRRVAWQVIVHWVTKNWTLTFPSLSLCVKEGDSESQRVYSVSMCPGLAAESKHSPGEYARFCEGVRVGCRVLGSCVGPVSAEPN